MRSLVPLGRAPPLAKSYAKNFRSQNRASGVLVNDRRE